ncbi:MAG: LamG-like jellyroll fold domain-containing protein, partial [Candidatus Brocadiaceae bacterium]
MKSAMKVLWIAFFLFSHIFALSDIYAQSDWRNWYGIVWRDTPENTIEYARQMGYDYIAARSYYVSTYKNNPDCAGLKYYIIDPHWDPYVYTDLPDVSSLGTDVQRGKLVDATKSYTQDQKNWYNKRMVWKSNDPFPYNLAPSVFPELNPDRFTVVWDLQQQAVINELVDKIIRLFKSYENPNLPFTFMGYGLDVPRLNNEFRYLTSTGAVRTTLVHWTKTDSGLLHDNITHEYSSFTEGMYAFYKQLNNRMRQEFPNAKWIIEPARIYDGTGSVSGDEWVYSIKNRADKDELTPDMISQEGPVSDFVDNSNNFNSGVNITKDRVGCSQNSIIEEDVNRLIAAKAGDNGAWFNWFGRFGGFRTMPDFQSIADVYPRLKLIRCIPNWDNLNNVPLLNRSWDGNIYQSPKSYISSDVMYSYHPKTGKLFAVFLTTKGVIKLNTGEKVISVKRADDFFLEAEDGASDVNIVGSEITLKSGVAINVDASNGQVMGNGYIFTLGSSKGIPTVITSAATNVTSNAATLNGKVNANGLSTTVWFEYGTTSLSYTSKSSTQIVSGNTDINIGINVSGMLATKTNYYRIVAQNSAGIVYGNEMSFSATDTTAPVCSITINDNAPYTRNTSVILDISATDSVGVTGYYLSAASTKPKASATGWKTVSSTINYNDNVSYTLSTGNGSKTVYAWCKDAAGNVSNTASDTIILDTTTPAIAIITPTSNDTFSMRSNTIRLSGNVSDNGSGVSKITWSNDRGGNGIITGTASWTTTDINLATGRNIITVTATDGVGNIGTDTITVNVMESIIANALQVYYSLNEGSGSVVTDTSGNGNNGSINGATWTTGKIKGGLKFNGTSNYVSVPRKNYDEISVAAWFYKNVKDTSYNDGVFSALRWDSTVQVLEGYEIRFISSAPDTIEFVLVTQNMSGTKTYKINRSNLINSVGNWYHVVGVYEKTTGKQRLYVNGQLVDTQTHPTGNTVVPLAFYSDMRVGYSRVNSGYFNGTIDEIYLYKAALTDQEVLELYKGPSDNLAPTGSIVINKGAAYTNSTNVTFNLVASDDTSIIGYNISTNSAIPSPTDSGWVSVTPAANLNIDIPYTLVGGDGNKTLFVWYKDSSGNVSSTKSDTINLDTIDPGVTITSPTSAATYTTANNTINLSGSAADSGSGINAVMWNDDQGHSGTASGTTSWTISNVGLAVGDTIITVMATDGAGNTGTGTITVSYAGTPASGGRVILYTFDEGNGTAAHDTSGNGNDGIINGTTWTAGKYGNALSFNGTNSYVSISNSLPAFSEFTCSAWVNAADLAANRGIFTSGGANASGFRFRVNSTGAIWLMMAGGGSYTTVSTGTGIIQSGSFYHICVTGKSGQYMRI